MKNETRQENFSSKDDTEQNILPTAIEKFGDDKAIVELLSKGRIIRQVNLDEIRPELKGTHQNRVDLLNIEDDQERLKLPEGHVNKAIKVEIKTGDNTISGIFKPLSGENPEIKSALKIENCYKREVAAYILDRMLGFNLVPPTVIREVNGDIGSLQLYIPPETADTHGNLSDIIDFPLESNGKDWMLMAAFDYISANWERKPDNWLVNKKNNQLLYAIDHGFAFYTQSENFEKRGPRRHLTYDNSRGKEKQTPLPNFVIDILRKINESEVRHRLKEYLPDHELNEVISRIQKLLEAKVFI